MARQSMERTANISHSFIRQRERNVRKILNTLIHQEVINPQSLQGTGMDLGCWIGASTYALRKFGADIISVEQAENQARQGVRLGLIRPEKLIIGKAEEVLPKQTEPLDFLTFFGLSKAANPEELFKQAKRLLKPGGFLLITTMPELEEDIGRLTIYGGQRIKPNSDYWWDAVGFLFKQSKGQLRR